MALVQFRAPALPLPKKEYEFGQMNELVRALRIYFNQLDSLAPNQAQSYRADAFFGGEFTGIKVEGGTLGGFGLGLEVPYALIMSDQDQDSAGITSENIVTLNRVIFSDGINVENNSRITFAYSGQYLITARFQFANRGNADQIFEIWAKSNGVNYPLSNTRFDIPDRKSLSVYSHVTANISGVFTVTSQDYLEFAWWSDGADMYIEHYAAGTSPTRPEIASVIVTVTFVSALPARFVPVLRDELVITGAAPIVISGVVPSPPVGSLSIQGVAPTVTIA
jgi:hypothetical protein